MSTNAPIETRGGPDDSSVEQRVGRALYYFAIGGAAFLAAIFLDLYGIPALIAESAVLVVAVAVRSRTFAIIIATGSAFTFVLFLRALSMCDPSFQDCSLSAGIFVFMTWLVALAVLGALAAVVMRPRRAANQ